MKKTGSFVHLPLELEYLIEPAMTVGVNHFDADINRYLDNATDEQWESLESLSEKIHQKGHMEAIDLFLDEYSITEYKESANLYFLFAVMDAADVLPKDGSWNSVDNHIKSLGKFGSYRLASGRMWAARFLADFGYRAKTAVPYLKKALNDEDERVRVWAHYALLIIDGDRDEHEAAIRQIYSQHDERDDWDMLDYVGMEAHAALEKLAQENVKARLIRWIRNVTASFRI